MLFWTVQWNREQLTFAKRAELFKLYHIVKINSLLFSRSAQKLVSLKSTWGVGGRVKNVSVFSNPLPPLMFPSPPTTLCWSNDAMKPWAIVVKSNSEMWLVSVGALSLFSPLAFLLHSGKWKRWRQRNDACLDSCCTCDYAIICLLFPYMGRILMKCGVPFLISRLNAQRGTVL